MTWNELNTITGDMLPDMLSYQWDELVDEGSDDEPVWSCLALDGIIETMAEITDDPQCLEDYSTTLTELRRIK